ncbi:uncharacterized protein LOC126847895 [Adelges cooleyi]|uniref:uncharacterized protein LOC126837636 n=1 Tax=Adelges cooleyi TaxID=133065 RepID=UPI00217FE282|nr:uncharacterized protein LOC126837636 [Adelges cooleyi]XP_050444262.1 uncharacterized protein LOC126847895 [Adelges cooleyi]
MQILVKLSYMFAGPAKAMDIDKGNEKYEEILQQGIDSQKELQKELTTSLGLVRTAMRKFGWTCDSKDAFALTGFLEIQQERISLTSEAIILSMNLVLNPDYTNYRNSKLMCRLKGVYRSILHPDEFTVEAEVVDDKCHLTGIDNKLHEISVFGLDLSETHH